MDNNHFKDLTQTKSNKKVPFFTYAIIKKIKIMEVFIKHSNATVGVHRELDLGFL